jgi:Ca-activated chloride channel family protein
VGATNPQDVLGRVRASRGDGVELSTIGFGEKSFNDTMMERLADNGDGNYFFVDSYREAQRVFGDRLCGTLHTIAKDVKIQVEFNPDAVLRHRLIGYENRRLKHHQFRDDAVDAGEIGAGHAVTALYAIELADEPASRLATVRIRHKEPDADTARELDFNFQTEELVRDVRRASADFKFAAAVALFGTILEGDEPADEGRLSLIREIAGEGITDKDNQPDRVEFLGLVDEATPYFVD